MSVPAKYDGTGAGAGTQHSPTLNLSIKYFYQLNLYINCTKFQSTVDDQISMKFPHVLGMNKQCYT